ncbi:MAG: MFS transporter, partial [Gemmatimonadales bacterium]
MRDPVGEVGQVAEVPEADAVRAVANAQAPEIRRPRRAPVFPALQHRNYRLFYAGFVVSLLGVWMQRVAQSWLVLELTDSAFWVGAVGAVTFVPVLLFTLYAGVVADRVPRRSMVVVTQTGSMIAALALAALALGGIVELWHVVVLAAVLGTANAFDIPARHALMVDLVGRDDLTNAVALNSSAFNATRVVGPAIAGVLVATVGVGVCFLVNGISYVAVIAALLTLKLPRAERPRGLGPSAWSRLRDGFRHVVGDIRTRTLIINIATVSIFGLPAMVLLPVMARDVLGYGAQAYGWMMSAMGLGALAGALGLAVFGHRLPRGRLLGWGARIFGLCVALFGISPWLPLSLVILVALGFSMIIMTALTNTLIQTFAPDELRARVVAFYAWAFVGLSPIGAFLAGTVAEWVGTPWTIAGGGTICLLVAYGIVGRSDALWETR